MGPTFTRREVIQTLAAAAAVPRALAAAEPRPTVGIVGAGMAGVSLAWLLDGQRDVVLIEGGDAIGGNVQSVTVNVGGRDVVVDAGAQYFHPGPYPLYTALLTQLGIYPPASAVPPQSHAFTATITVADAAETVPRFVSPVFPGRIWPLLAPWNFAGVVAFAVGFGAARLREQAEGSWTTTLEEWLPTLGLTREQWEGMLLPWAASLFSGSIEQARTLSARSAMVFAAKALSQNPFDPIVYYVLNQGMAEALRRMVAQCSTLQVLTGASVRRVANDPQGGFRIHRSSGPPIRVDDLVLACSRDSTLNLLQGLQGMEQRHTTLGGIEFHDARLALHTDPVYVQPELRFWSFLNCRRQGEHCEASMWMAPVLTDVPLFIRARLWKSWVTRRDQQPAEVLHEARFRHMLPTATTIRAQEALRPLQGQYGVWLAGGYLHPYDAQETAFMSAIEVARGLGVTKGPWL
jgi:predicted NAD/FAD-binding protein